MQYDLIEEQSFKYYETKGGEENLLLLHGLFGALTNFEGIIPFFDKKYNVVFPILPIFELPIHKVSVGGLVEHISKFVAFKNFKNVHLLGNSLGGHIALLFALAHPEKTASLTLTGSSGLFESAMGSTFPKRGDYDFIKKKTQATFFDPAIANKELVDGVFEIVNNRNKAIRILATSKSAIRQNIGDRLHDIKAPTLLIWGKQDIITPPFVAEKFNELIKQSKLIFMDNCGHAPMLEYPIEFSRYWEDFLLEVIAANAAPVNPT